MGRDTKMVSLAKSVHQIVEALKIELSKPSPKYTMVKTVVDSLSIQTVALLGEVLSQESKDGVK